MDRLNITTEILDLEEARLRLPEVKKHLAALVEATAAVQAFHQRLGDRPRLEDGERAERDRLRADWEDHLRALNELGAYLKDAEVGLIDFYTWRDDDLAFLCYRHGEEDITTWHELDEGFDARKPLEDDTP